MTNFWNSKIDGVFLYQILSLQNTQKYRMRQKENPFKFTGEGTGEGKSPGTKDEEKAIVRAEYTGASGLGPGQSGACHYSHPWMQGSGFCATAGKGT